jgi:phosphoribosylglycinamide formyltransferase 2
VPEVALLGPAASAVILADRDASNFSYKGVGAALAQDGADVDVRLFGKPTTRPFRRMGVALARASDVEAARRIARQAADAVSISYD